MTVKQFYEEIHGDYEEILGRLASEDRIKRFLIKFLETDDMTSLKAAWKDNNIEEIFGYAHRIKGISLNLSLSNLATYSSELTEEYRGGGPKDEQKAQEWYSKCVEEYEMIVANIAKIE